MEFRRVLFRSGRASPRGYRPAGLCCARRGAVDGSFDAWCGARADTRSLANASAGSAARARSARRRVGGADGPWEHAGHGHGTRGFKLPRSEEHTSELQSLMRISYDLLLLKIKHYTTPISSYPSS